MRGQMSACLGVRREDRVIAEEARGFGVRFNIYPEYARLLLAGSGSAGR